MLKKIVLASALAMTCLPFVAKAQADFQLYYDFGSDRQYVSTTFELFKADQYGDTFIFVDHYFSNKDNREAGLYSAINGSYFEIERAINFWQDTKLGALSAHIEYDGSSWGASILQTWSARLTRRNTALTPSRFIPTPSPRTTWCSCTTTYSPPVERCSPPSSSWTVSILSLIHI